MEVLLTLFKIVKVKQLIFGAEKDRMIVLIGMHYRRMVVVLVRLVPAQVQAQAILAVQVQAQAILAVQAVLAQAVLA